MNLNLVSLQNGCQTQPKYCFRATGFVTVCLVVRFKTATFLKASVHYCRLLAVSVSTKKDFFQPSDALRNFETLIKEQLVQKAASV